jgi:hypothetical protein
MMYMILAIREVAAVPWCSGLSDLLHKHSTCSRPGVAVRAAGGPDLLRPELWEVGLTPVLGSLAVWTGAPSFWKT